jgi:H+/Cl- antiporter ClcA
MWLETFLGILAGVCTRAVVPYLVKLRNNPNLKYDSKYLLSAYIGFVLSLIASFIIYMQLGRQMIFFDAFTASFTLHSLTSSTQKALGF